MSKVYASREEAQAQHALWLPGTVAAAAMGFGKTRFALLKAQWLASVGQAPLILAEAQVVLDHILREAKLHGDIPVTLMHGRHKVKAEPGRIVVSMLQTACRRDLTGFTDIILDECDRNVGEDSAMIAKVLGNGAVLYGCTGTVTRLLKGHNVPSLDPYFKAGLSFEYSTAMGIEHGILVPSENLAASIKYESFDRSACSINAVTGELDASILACSPHGLQMVHNGIGHALRFVAGPKVLVHCSSIKHAMLLGERLRHLGPVAVCHSDMADEHQDAAIANAKAGHATFLLGVGMLSRGFDWPECNLVVLAFCTKSEARFVQAAARGGRAALGKEHNLLLDFGGNFEEFGSPDKSARDRLELAIAAKEARERRERELAEQEQAIEVMNARQRQARERKRFLCELSTMSLSESATRFFESLPPINNDRINGQLRVMRVRDVVARAREFRSGTTRLDVHFLSDWDGFRAVLEVWATGRQLEYSLPLVAQDFDVQIPDFGHEPTLKDYEIAFNLHDFAGKLIAIQEKPPDIYHKMLPWFDVIGPAVRLEIKDIEEGS